ncbi:MAG TPA: hypothetical protein VJR23_10585 [Candidatus Acidoferrales bacterium]|nr:hypothetical protein [Candidatus Acidoferrales bacterium]
MRIGLLKLAKPIQKRKASLGRDGIDESSLAALPSRRALTNPTPLHEAPKQWVNKIIMQRGLPRQHARLLLERVSMLGAGEKHGQHH